MHTDSRECPDLPHLPSGRVFELQHVSEEPRHGYPDVTDIPTLEISQRYQYADIH